LLFVSIWARFSCFAFAFVVVVDVVVVMVVTVVMVVRSFALSASFVAAH
jgi:hypothetical protein